jgi:hypothetical protein
MRKLSLALLSAVTIIGLTAPSYAIDTSRCRPGPDIVTPSIPGADITEQRDIIEIQKQYATYTGSDAGGSNYASLLRVCDPDSTHPWHDAMVKNGACIKTGAELRSMTSHTGGTVLVAKKPVKVGEETVVVGQEPDIDVPDIPQYETGELDVKDSAKESAKASLEATKNAPENQGKPFWEWTPHVVVVEVVDWSGSYNEGSC